MICLSKYDDSDLRKNSSERIETGQTSHKSRRQRRMEQEEKDQESNTKSENGNKTPKKKNKIRGKQVIKFLICLILAAALGCVAYATVVVVKAPKIETDDIYSLLSQSSVLYDDKGEIIDSVFGKDNRTVVEISKIPDHVQKAFISLEDKTFEKHHGFNIIRIFGAIKDAVTYAN